MTSFRFEIDIQNRSRNRRIPIAKIKALLGKMLKILGWQKAALSILLADDRQIRGFNRRYLGHDRATDVMAFSQLEGLRLKTAGSHPVFMGDVVVSLQTIRRQAAEYGNTFFYEFVFCLCHGILHLMGNRDGTKREAARMGAKQKKILKKLGVFPPSSEKPGLSRLGRSS